MELICKRCKCKFHIESNQELVCEDCNVQLGLLEKEKKINDERIKKLEEHKKSELNNPTSEETMKRIEYNLKNEYRKREGLIEQINSKIDF